MWKDPGGNDQPKSLVAVLFGMLYKSDWWMVIQHILAW